MINKKKKYNILAITTSRADYGLLKDLLVKINKEKKINLTVLATEIQNEKKSKNNNFEINEEKFKRVKKIDLGFKTKFKKDIINNILKTIKSSNYFLKKKIDLLIILGDRYEIFCYAFVAHILNIPIAHFNGGEITTGSIDDAFRHSITKFSQLHFVSNKIYKKRVIQLGENPKSIHVVGEIGLENIKKFKFFEKNFLFNLLKLNKIRKTILITYHNETIEDYKLNKLNILLNSLKNIDNCNLVFTGSNKDYGGEHINKQIKNFVKKKKNAYFFYSLGRKKYISLLKYSDLVLGNSSSGVVEAPTLKVPSIDLGSRQNGRLKAKSVINSDYNTNELKKKINKCLSKKIAINNFKNPYEFIGGIDKAIKIIKKTLKNKIKLKKNFYDL